MRVVVGSFVPTVVASRRLSRAACRAAPVVLRLRCAESRRARHVPSPEQPRRPRHTAGPADSSGFGSRGFALRRSGPAPPGRAEVARACVGAVRIRREAKLGRGRRPPPTSARTCREACCSPPPPGSATEQSQRRRGQPQPRSSSERARGPRRRLPHAPPLSARSPDRDRSAASTARTYAGVVDYHRGRLGSVIATSTAGGVVGARYR